jgi:uncharacterized protein YjiS (DUF1127 family)
MHRLAQFHDRLQYRAPGPRLAPLLRWLAEAAERQHSRRQLRELNERALQDLGLTRLDAEAEAQKPFWR